MGKILLTLIFFLTSLCQLSFGQEAERPVVLRNYVLKLNYKNDQSILTSQQKEKIRVYMNSMRFEGKVLNVRLGVWSDKPFPPEEGVLFTRRDKELVNARIERIALYMNEDLKVKDIIAFNMALNSERLADRLDVDPEELVSLFRREGVYVPEREDIEAFLEYGGSGRAVIFTTVAEPVYEVPKR